MVQRTRTNYADLLRAFGLASSERQISIAKLCGFVPIHETTDSFSSLKVSALLVDEEPPAKVSREPERRIRESVPLPFQLFMPVRFKPLEERADKQAHWLYQLAPISPEELRKPENPPPLPAKVPLMPWSRLWPFLRRALSRVQDGPRPDIRRLVKTLSTLSPPRELPKLPVRRWSDGSWILVERTAALEPFFEDMDSLLHALKPLRGRGALQHKSVLAGPPFSLPPSGTPLLVLGDLGLYENREITDKWAAFGRLLQKRQCPAFGLVPCPRQRWSESIARSFTLALWDEGIRPPLSGVGQRALPSRSSSEPHPGLEDLKVMMTPALGISPRLLRALCRLLGPGIGDVGLEHDVFNSASFARNLDRLALPPKDAMAYRPEFSALKPEPRQKIAELIQAHMVDCSSPIRAKQTLLLAECGAPISQESITEATEILRRCCVKLKDLMASSKPGQGVDIRKQGFDRYIERELSRFCSRGDEEAALCWLASIYLYRPGMASCPPELSEVDLRALHDLLEKSTATEERWRLVQMLDELEVRPQQKEAFQTEEASLEVGRTLALIKNRGNWLDLTLAYEDSSQNRVQWDISAQNKRCSLSQVRSFTMKSSTEEREWKIARHPPGASLFAWDRFGVCVEFQVQDTRFKMRWIPPGSFVMGSPSDEPGRWEAEGPQHRVHIERGFWLGATPVTQGQYLAVTKKTPSYFKNAGFDAPVESVSWQEAREFCKGLTEKLPHLQPGSSFGLPSEAQWEYACRAGTQTALYTGNITIKGENNAPELDPIAWYGGNSGVEYEGGGDSSGWKEKQYESQRSGTHPVARKKPNALGLYDMLGNVWEWCEDDWHGDYQNAPTDGSAWVGPGDRQGRYRVLRGGSWISSARRCRSAARDGFGSGLRDHDLGFRLVLAPSSTENPEDFLEQEERVQRTVSAVPRAEPGQKQDTESETSRPPGWLGTIRQAIFGKDKDEDKKRG